jgi:Protein of unknown function (DUF2384)
MLRFARRAFPDALAEAWADFNLAEIPLPKAEAFGEGQIFMPYFLFEWDPERPSRSRSAMARPGHVARAFVQRAGSRLSELEALILAQAIAQPVTFYEVVRCEPGQSIVFRDVLAGGDTEVVERSASQMLRPGDVAYGQIWRLPDVSTLGRLAPIAIPPGRKVEIISLRARLRKRIAKQNRELATQDLIRYAEEIREVYLDIRDALLRPPRLTNTDGDPLEFHTLTFRVGSAMAAFEALAPLAAGSSKKELLQGAVMDPDGTLRNVSFEWTKRGNLKFDTWDNTILGHLRISGHELVAEVNSQSRAEKIRREIEKRLGILVTHQKTIRQTPQQMLRKNREETATSGRTVTVPGGSAFSAEIRKDAQRKIQEQAEGWVHQRIPALGGRTPFEAVQDPDGREMVEALLTDWERHYPEPVSPETIRPDIGAVRCLLGITASGA